MPATKIIKPLRCLILNPYNKTLSAATIPQTLENWYAIMGTDNVQVFHLKNCTCLYADDYRVHSHPYLFGTTFPDWTQPVTGVLIFVGHSDEEGETTALSKEAEAAIKAKFLKAKIRVYNPIH